MLGDDAATGDGAADDDGMFTHKSGGSTPSPKFRRTAMDILKKQEHASLRMEEGLKRMLQLHTPNELSSICGQLGLKILQKASVSIDQIATYMTSQNKEKVITVDVAEKVLGCLWETPLLEYLRSTGHPIHPLKNIEPRKAVLQLWVEGGFVLPVNATDFVPHFVAREVKRRYQLSTLSKDILSTLERIRLQQEKVKRAEATIMIDRDYRHILKYFKELGDLRSMENTLRDVLVSELDIARAEKDSATETTEMVSAQLGEAEQQLVAVASDLNAQLAAAECLMEGMLRERLKGESELQRLSSVVDSFIAAETDRSTRGGGALQPTCMHNVADDCGQEVLALHEKLRGYRDMRDSRDDALREESRRQHAEIIELRRDVARLRADKEEMAAAAADAQARATLRLAAVAREADALAEEVERRAAMARENRAAALRAAAAAADLQRHASRATALVSARITHALRTAAKEALDYDATAAADLAQAANDASAAATAAVVEAAAAAAAVAASKGGGGRGGKGDARSPSPAKKAPDRGKSPPPSAKGKRPAEATPVTPVTAVTAAPQPLVPAASAKPMPAVPDTTLLFQLAGALGLSEETAFLSLREWAEQLHMAADDRRMQAIVVQERVARELQAATEAAAAEAAAAAAAAAKKGKGGASTMPRQASPTPAVAIAGIKGAGGKAPPQKGGSRAGSPAPVAAPKARNTSPEKAGSGAKSVKKLPGKK